MTSEPESLNLSEKLRKRAESYRLSGPSAEHTAALLDEAATRIEEGKRELAVLTEELTELRQRLRDEEERMFAEAKRRHGGSDV